MDKVELRKPFRHVNNISDPASLLYSPFLGIRYSHARNLYSVFIGMLYSHGPESALLLGASVCPVVAIRSSAIGFGANGG